jgi:hypothetical protein
VDNNYLDLGMNKSGFVHTLPVAGLHVLHAGQLAHDSHDPHIVIREPLVPVHDATASSVLIVMHSTNC